MQLIVAEKPSVARDLARVLGVRPVGAHWYEGDRRVITWCIGHLVEIDEPAAHDPVWRSWRLDTLPILPPELLLRPARHAVPQLRAVLQLLGDRRFTSVVNACDAGREGELIFRSIYRHAGGGPPVQRLWISSLTDEAIRRGFSSLAPGTRFDPLGDAARSRSEADWLVGMNATRALTTRARFAGHDALYSIGRVQTPTLAMLVRREQEIRSFVPRDYWEIRGDFRTTKGERFSAIWRHGPASRLATGELAETISDRDRTHGSALDPIGPRVEAVRSRTVREPPPQLFDLTSLQRTANRRFGFSAARTLEIAQALYERHKLLTYPRTDSRHLASDHVAELPNLFRTLAAVPDYTAFCTPLLARPIRPNRRIVDDTKVSDHHAIIPTGKAIRLDVLGHDERRLFDLVARRFLGAFYPDAVFAVTEAWIRVGKPDGTRPPQPQTSRDEPPILEVLPPPPDRYLARGRVRLEAGWQVVAGIEPAAPNPTPRDDDSDRALLPPLVEGQPLDGAFTPVAKQTRPPPRFTEATLLGAMETAGKSISDEALRAAMRDCGLGTPATRASIIETLLDRRYIERDRQNLVPTPLGIQLVDTLPVASLASAELTGAWEARLAAIARGEQSRATFMADIARYVREIVDAIRNASLPPPPVGSAPRPPPGRSPMAAPVPFGGSPAPFVDGALGSRGSSVPFVDGASGLMGSSVPFVDGAMRALGSSVPFIDGAMGSMGSSVPFVDGAMGASTARVSAPKSAAPKSGKRVRRSATAPKRARSKPARATPPTSATPSAPKQRATSATPSAPEQRATPATSASKQRATPATSATPSAPKQRATPATSTTPSASKQRATPATSATPRASSHGASTSTRVSTDPTSALACPRCRTGQLVTGARGWGCARWREGCPFIIWFETAGRTLTEAELRELVVEGATRARSFVENGVEIEARLVLDPDARGGAARLDRG